MSVRLGRLRIHAVRLGMPRWDVAERADCRGRYWWLDCGRLRVCAIWVIA
jgi:hypothetical protein